MADTQIKTSDGWKSLSSLYAKTSSGWKEITYAYAKTSSGWKEVWASAEPGTYLLKHFELPTEATGLYVADEIIDGVPYYKGNPVII